MEEPIRVEENLMSLRVAAWGPGSGNPLPDPSSLSHKNMYSECVL